MDCGTFHVEMGFTKENSLKTFALFSVHRGNRVRFDVDYTTRGQFMWANGEQAITTTLNPEQLRALVAGLPWQTLTHDHAITVV
ncbi:hypothetical protein [Burkholderia stagnalis]|uniref:hypothetical protein n=1 Tax=Burkholderia stagnalis TaxID=1503054 RepID=UPI000AEBFA76|nr:hypothetical protein [Burkholderia stagnalis]MDY7804175.1 hypothetical protein [Burkholderia stagnalis]